MGATIASATVASKTVENDDDLAEHIPNLAGGVPTIAFVTFGTTPSVVSLRGGGGHFRLSVLSGTGSGTASSNNIQITFSRPPRKVFIWNKVTSTIGAYVDNFSGNTVNIGMKVGSAASTQYDFEFIVLF